MIKYILILIIMFTIVLGKEHHTVTPITVNQLIYYLKYSDDTLEAEGLFYKTNDGYLLFIKKGKALNNNFDFKRFNNVEITYSYDKQWYMYYEHLDHVTDNDFYWKIHYLFDERYNKRFLNIIRKKYE